ncbi:MAG TPA: response regulator [Candidatus Cloacimonadota bacterium]|nr:response regulator [Candidatus Cloacimonadota bacterium]HOD53304.1 response regulator [Candidatus Cloacimonadota bacterium]HPM00966.1 response regulator [Candidatus Cloacimonadota bacterium]
MKTIQNEVIIIEDNDDHAELIVRALKNKQPHLNISRLNDGEKAIDYLSSIENNKSRYPRMILLDLRLPKHDGIEVLSMIKNSKTLCIIPVIVFSSSDEHRDILNAYNNHANSYLVKPMDFNKLQYSINELSDYWLNLNIHLYNPL